MSKQNQNKDDLREEKEITEEDLRQLLDSERLLRAEREANERRKQLSKEHWHKLRVRAKRDLYFLSYGVLNYTRLSPNLHGEMCTIIENTYDYRFRMFMYPRGHFKSTVITISHSIQTVLPYTEEDKKYDEYIDAFGEIPHPMNLGPDCRLLIGHETAEGAARFLFAITNHFVSNPLLMALFPDVVPSKRRHRINKWELELPRNHVWPEPTIDTMGVGAKSQGRHYNYIKLDDIYGDKARDSQAEHETTIQWLDNIQSFFDKFSEDRIDWPGTRYKYDDAYAHLMESYGTQMFVVRKPVEQRVEVGQEKDGTPTFEMKAVFPEEFTPQVLSIIRKNKKVFSSQYLNDPDYSESGFEPGWKRFFYWLDPLRIAVFSGQDRTVIHVRDCDLCILIDPGVEKSGGYAVTGMDYKGRIFILQSLRLELKPPDLVELIFKGVQRWQPRLVAIESDIFANTYQYWLRSEMQKRGTYFMVQPVYTKKKAKDLRIEGLTTYYSAGQIYMNEQQTDMLREYDQWGKTGDIHILDALAYGPEIWRPGYPPGTRSAIHQSGQDESGRDPVTGYSVI